MAPLIPLTAERGKRYSSDGACRCLTHRGMLASLRPARRLPPRGPRMNANTHHSSSREPVIEFHGVSYRLPSGQTLLSDVSFTVSSGETLVLLGRSGAGKTTALKLINRLLDVAEGDVRVEGRATKDWNPILLRRHIGYVIQDVGLFPHFTVAQNISLVPRLEGWPTERIRARVDELLGLVGLDSGQFVRRYPHELSGGQRQRVGVARALAADPPILLMDEPFGALDPLTRGEVQREFQALKKRLRKTIVIVTHDVREALQLGTRIGVLEAGKLVGIYSPQEFLRATEPVTAEYAANLRMQIGEEEAP
jgi:osmoprotectant transport system ATP-binding protein